MKHIFSFLCLVLLTACAIPQTQYLQGTNDEIAAEAEKQKELVLQRHYDTERRVKRVAYPILAKNTELCGEKVGPTYGIGAWNTHVVGREYEKAATNLFGLDEHIQLYITVDGSPAAKAGLDRGDKVIAIDGQEIKPGRNAMKDFTQKLAKKEYEETEFTVLRNGEEKSFTVTPAKTCNTRIQVLWGKPEINAFADGKNIYITEGMIRFIENDDELALVIAHELGHNGMGHVEAKQKNAIGAGLIGLALEIAVASQGGYVDGTLTNNMMAAGAQAYSVEFEQEADYVGLYMMARAGYPTSEAANFWRRMASEADAESIKRRSTHPTSPERFIAIEKAHDEIKTKRTAGKKLMPNIKPKSEQKLKVDEGGSFKNLN